MTYRLEVARAPSACAWTGLRTPGAAAIGCWR